MAQKQMQSLDELWVIVWLPFRSRKVFAVPPFDSSESRYDDGMLVYRSLKAAKRSAAHQNQLYGDSEAFVAAPMRLDEYARSADPHYTNVGDE